MTGGTQERAVQRQFWSGKRVLVTGHTGFKGSWLTLWLHELGAEVCGFALPASTSPNLFDALALSELCRHEQGDVRDAARLTAVVRSFRPELVLHLAAQPIVLESYRNPVDTFSTNVLGTVQLLEALRSSEDTRVCVVVTSDKCYENREWSWGYREVDPLGGRDPYSASKACQELVTAAYRSSFFAPTKQPTLAVASARAGNVIGGGDWAESRLVPDFARALSEGRPAIVRNPCSVRPWQHVLDPLRGYLLLAQACGEDPTAHARGYNFGPAEDDSAPVSRVADLVTRHWGNGARWEHEQSASAPSEAGLLRLDCSLARHRLGWAPRLGLPDAIRLTVEWYKAFYDERETSALRELTVRQIRDVGGSD